MKNKLLKTLLGMTGLGVGIVTIGIVTSCKPVYTPTMDLFAGASTVDGNQGIQKVLSDGTPEISFNNYSATILSVSIDRPNLTKVNWAFSDINTNNWNDISLLKSGYGLDYACPKPGIVVFTVNSTYNKPKCKDFKLKATSADKPALQTQHPLIVHYHTSPIVDTTYDGTEILTESFNEGFGRLIDSFNIPEVTSADYSFDTIYIPYTIASYGTHIDGIQPNIFENKFNGVGFFEKCDNIVFADRVEDSVVSDSPCQIGNNNFCSSSIDENINLVFENIYFGQGNYQVESETDDVNLFSVNTESAGGTASIHVKGNIDIFGNLSVSSALSASLFASSSQSTSNIQIDGNVETHGGVAVKNQGSNGVSNFFASVSQSNAASLTIGGYCNIGANLMCRGKDDTDPGNVFAFYVNGANNNDSFTVGDGISISCQTIIMSVANPTDRNVNFFYMPNVTTNSFLIENRGTTFLCDSPSSFPPLTDMKYKNNNNIAWEELDPLSNCN